MPESSIFNNITASDIIAVCAVLISLLSLIATIWQLNSNKQHNVLSVRPSVNIDWDITSDERISCVLSNKGIGPAYLSNMKFRSGNRIEEITSVNNFISFFNKSPVSNFERDFGNEFGVRYGGFDCNAVIPPGKSLLVMDFYGVNNNFLNRDLVLDYIENIEIEIIYKCAYEKKYTYNSTNIKTLLDLP